MVLRTEPTADLQGPSEPVDFDTDPDLESLRRHGHPEYVKNLRTVRHEERWFRFQVRKESIEIPAAKIEDVVARSDERPAPIWRDQNARTFWLYQGSFYSEAEHFDAEEMQVLILERALKKKRRVERAHAYVSGQQSKMPNRVPIADDVKTLVWRRDTGRCTSCGSKEKLEFDHIIPLALGGSNTPRNLQLLCEVCNRQKGPNLHP